MNFSDKSFVFRFMQKCFLLACFLASCSVYVSLLRHGDLPPAIYHFEVFAILIVAFTMMQSHYNDTFFGKFYFYIYPALTALQIWRFFDFVKGGSRIFPKSVYGLFDIYGLILILLIVLGTITSILAIKNKNE